MLPIRSDGTKLMPKAWRINFRSTEYSARKDVEIFKHYIKGEYTAEMAAIAMSKNNDAPVTVQQFLANADWLGYIPRRKK